MTETEKQALQEIRELAPKAVKKMTELLDDENTSAALKVKICELILDRTYGKAPASVSVTSEAGRIDASRAYILSLVRRYREGREGVAGPADAFLAAGAETVQLSFLSPEGNLAPVEIPGEAAGAEAAAMPGIQPGGETADVPGGVPGSETAELPGGDPGGEVRRPGEAGEREGRVNPDEFR